MDVRPEDPIPAADQVNPAKQGVTDNVPPGLRDSFVIAMDSLLTFIRLFKAESSLALSALPLLIALNVQPREKNGSVTSIYFYAQPARQYRTQSPTGASHLRLRSIVLSLHCTEMHRVRSRTLLLRSK